MYAVPDERTADDQVMAAIELDEGETFDPDAFAAFLAEQPDLGTKWAPRYVRVDDAAGRRHQQGRQAAAARRALVHRRPDLVAARAASRPTGRFTGRRPGRPRGPVRASTAGPWTAPEALDRAPQARRIGSVEWLRVSVDGT